MEGYVLTTRRQAVAAPILGVHRSGTSALAAIVQSFDIPIGDIGDQASDENPKGFFESQTLRHVNDDLFTFLESSWDNWAFDAGRHNFREDHFAPFRERALAAIDQLFGKAALWSVKDPRMAQLWPFWQLVLAQASFTIRPIIIIRPPHEVAMSQIARASRNLRVHRELTDEEDVAALWALTMLNILEHVGPEGALLVVHGDLVYRTGDTLDRIRAYLRVRKIKAAKDFAADFIEQDYHRAKGEVPDGPWMTIASRLFADIQAAAVDGIVTQAAAAELAAGQGDLHVIRPMLDCARRAVWRARENSEDAWRYQQILPTVEKLADRAFKMKTDQGHAMARSAYRHLLRVDGPQLLTLWRGVRLAKWAGDREEARRLLRQVVDLYPEFQPAQDALARSRAKKR